MVNKTTMQFIYAERELLLVVGDVLAAAVDVVVCPARGDLAAESGLAARIADAAGEAMRAECVQMRREHGVLESGMAVYTGAGALPCKAVVHAIVPEPGERDPQGQIELALSRCLQVCDMNAWRSLALPALGCEDACVSVQASAQACFRAITRFWDARSECALEQIRVCLEPAQFRAFFEAFREQGADVEPIVPAAPVSTGGAAEPVVGHVDLSEDAGADLDDTGIAGWFK